MFTADSARQLRENDLDERIRKCIERSDMDGMASIRVYAEDWFAGRLQEEMAKRGFRLEDRYRCPVYKEDFYFYWDN